VDAISSTPTDAADRPRDAIVIERIEIER
jgi:hypothetical protein